MADRKHNPFVLANRAWLVLTETAGKNATLNYTEFVGRVGLPHPRTAAIALAPVQDFCMERGLPPLTILVVRMRGKGPGSGFIAWSGDSTEGRRRVWDWEAVKAPFTSHYQAKLGRLKGGIQKPDPADFKVGDIEVHANGRGPYQAAFRKALLFGYSDLCALCDTRHKSLLVASHIVPWAEDPDNRLNPRNGLLLCANHDKLFENGDLLVQSNGTVNIIVDPKVVGGDLAAFLTRTRSEVRRARKDYEPAPQFLSWRVARQRGEV